MLRSCRASLALLLLLSGVSSHCVVLSRGSAQLDLQVNEIALAATLGIDLESGPH